MRHECGCLQNATALIKAALSLLIAASAFGCATTSSAGAQGNQEVKIVSASQKERCATIRTIAFNQRVGLDKPGNAMKAALKATAEVGGNGFYVISTSNDSAEGATVVGEALRC